MKPYVLISRPVSPVAVELLNSVCDTLPRVELGRRGHGDFPLVAGCTDALLLGTTERIDDLLLRDFPRLRVIACTFRLPEHIDVAACTRRGVWVTSVATRWPGTEAEIEAARNILDVFSGDTPRGAMNEVLPSAA
jgi:lactate dehydrogenase-like 2-hydroxyacid dehydrogenase